MMDEEDYKAAFIGVLIYIILIIIALIDKN